MKTKIFLLLQVVLFAVACPVFGEHTLIARQDQVVVVPPYVVVENHMAGRIVDWRPPYLVVRGECNIGGASGQPAVVIPDATITFKVTKKTKFPDGRQKDLQPGINARVTFFGSPERNRATADSILIPRKEGHAHADDDEKEAARKTTFIFNNFNADGVENEPRQSTAFVVKKNAIITSIRNYHWNKRRGAAPGSIWLVDQDGRRYGPWEAEGEPGAMDVPNAYWNVYPNINLKPGTYTIHDSDPTSWSRNSVSQDRGMSQVSGYHIDKMTNDTMTKEDQHDAPQATSAKTPPAITTTTPETTPTTKTPPTTTTTTPSPSIKTPPASTTQTQGNGWYLEGFPAISKNPYPKDECSHFGYALAVSDGSAKGSQSWKDCTNQTKCSGTYSGTVTWTKLPSYMKPGSKITIDAAVNTSAQNTCGYQNIGSGITVKGAGLYIDVIESRSPKGSSTASVPNGSPGSKMIIEVSVKAANLHGKVTYSYVYR